MFCVQCSSIYKWNTMCLLYCLSIKSCFKASSNLLQWPGRIFLLLHNLSFVLVLLYASALLKQQRLTTATIEKGRVAFVRADKGGLLLAGQTAIPGFVRKFWNAWLNCLVPDLELLSITDKNGFFCCQVRISRHFFNMRQGLPLSIGQSSNFLYFLQVFYSYRKLKC